MVAHRNFVSLDALHSVPRVDSFSCSSATDELVVVSETATYPNTPSVFIHSDEVLSPRSRGLLEMPVWSADANYVVRMPQGSLCRSVVPVSREGVVYHDLAVHAGRHQRPGFVHECADGTLQATCPWETPRIERGSAALLFFSGACGVNHSHWLVHAVPKIHIFEQAGVRPDFYVVTESIQSYQRETLHALGIHPAQILALSPEQPVQFDEIFVAYTNNPIHPDLAIYDRILALAGSGAATPERVYVPRLDARRMRRFLNERDVIRTAERLGFWVVDTTQLTFSEELQIFSNAKVIAGALGAGLCNALFMKPRSTVIALSDPEYIMDWQQQIASLRGHSMIHLLGNSFLSMESVHAGTHNSWCIDPALFEEAVKNYL